MPNPPGRPRKRDALKSLAIRLPPGLVLQLEAEAAAVGGTVSDALRTRLAAEPVRELKRPRPRQREKPLASVSGADPALLRQLASIGGLTNQVARRVNSICAAGMAIDVVETLVVLKQIERHLHDLARAEAARCT
jgi:hypothetical protein